jgi:hypothetical protein
MEINKTEAEYLARLVKEDLSKHVGGDWKYGLLLRLRKWAGLD